MSPTPAFHFRPLTKDDLPMLHEWLQRPHVRFWWGDPGPLSAVEEDYLPLTQAGSPTRAYVAQLAGEALGFIQSYVVKDSGGGWWEQETDPGARGTDQFLAAEDRLGQGLGTAMVAAFVERLFQDPAVSKVQTDPAPHNERAIRSYRRAGFRDQGVVDTPDGPALLMVRHRNNLSEHHG